MPAVTPARILRAVLNAVGASGGVGLVVRDGQPRELRIQVAGGELSIWAYVWTLTHGGRPTLPHEYRIQLTSVRSPLALNPDGVTVLIGYEPDLDMFAGFDLKRHRRFTPGSPSVQIDIRKIQQALQNGVAFDLKENNEIAVAFRPDHFLFYSQHSKELHAAGQSAQVLNLLGRAAARQNIRAADLALVPAQRQRVVEQVARFARAANFRDQVLNAYDRRCAVTRLQLRIAEAAHILPVAAGARSLDVVGNGIALSPSYHRAFDSGLIYLGEDLVMRVNRHMALDLRAKGLAAGLESFRAPLGRIHLPADRNQWPDPRFVRLANEFRGVH
ncbi:MAG: HNH endonuclease [Chloroflexi bacterium]|nr:HNH endonuclease [Chloroflexota bacterium]